MVWILIISLSNRSFQPSMNLYKFRFLIFINVRPSQTDRPTWCCRMGPRRSPDNSSSLELNKLAKLRCFSKTPQIAKKIIPTGKENVDMRRNKWHILRVFWKLTLFLAETNAFALLGRSNFSFKAVIGIPAWFRWNIWSLTSEVIIAPEKPAQMCKFSGSKFELLETLHIFCPCKFSCIHNHKVW